MVRKRISLYFNTDVELEEKMWEYISSGGENRKSYTIKKAIEAAMLQSDVPIKSEKKESKEIKSSNVNDIDEDDIDGAFF